MSFREDTLYLGDLNNELLVFRFGSNGVHCRLAMSIRYSGLKSVISCNNEKLVIEYYHKSLLGKKTVKTKTLKLDEIIKAIGLKDYHLNKMSGVEVVDDVRKIASWTANVVKE